MELFFTRHARERMEQRGITIMAVRRTIARPDIRLPSGNRLIMIKYIEGRRLEVVTAQEGDTTIVITVYYAS